MIFRSSKCLDYIVREPLSVLEVFEVLNIPFPIDMQMMLVAQWILISLLKFYAFVRMFSLKTKRMKPLKFWLREINCVNCHLHQMEIFSFLKRDNGKSSV
jgi:hypothetical protein